VPFSNNSIGDGCCGAGSNSKYQQVPATMGSSAAPANVREICRAQRADGPAAVLAIGTANPANCVPQDEFPDFYFRATKSDHLTGLKEKFKRVCKHAWNLTNQLIRFYYLPSRAGTYLD